MNKKIIYVFSFFIVLAFLFGVVYLSNQNKQMGKNGHSKIKVVATIFPLYDIVRNVAGEKVQVELVLPPGASPHTYDVKPGDVKRLEGSKVLFVIGQGLDNWAESLAKNAQVEKVVSVDEGISLIKAEEEEHDEGINPHYWLSPNNAKQIAKTVAKTLGEIDSDNKAEYQKNAEEFEDRVERTSVELKNKLNSLPNREIATFHDGWPYFASDFGLKIVAVFEEFPGKEPPPQYLAEFQKKVKESGVKVIFSEPQFARDLLEPQALDLGVKLSVLDPLGGIEERNSYIDLMKFNVNQIIEATK